MLGAYFGYRLAMSTARIYPEWGILLWPLVGVYLAFVLVSWFATPLSNLCLRLHPLGKLALSKDERRASNWVGGSLGCALVALAAWLALDSETAMVVAMMSGVFAIPLAMTFSCQDPQPRRWMTIYTAGVAALGAVALSMLLVNTLVEPETLASTLGGVKNLATVNLLAIRCETFFIWGSVLSVWAVNLAKSASWKR